MQVHASADQPIFVQPIAFGLHDLRYEKGCARRKWPNADSTNLRAMKPCTTGLGQAGAPFTACRPVGAKYTKPMEQFAQWDPQQLPQIALHPDAKSISLASYRRAYAKAFGGLQYV